MRALLGIDITDTVTTPGILDQAIAHCDRLCATLDVLYVDGPPFTDALLVEPTVEPYLQAAAQRLQDERRKKLEETVASLPEGIRGEAHYAFGGRAADHLVDRSSSYDLVLIGTHGRTGLSRVFLGSEAERTVRHAHGPVLVLRCPPEG